MIIENTHWKQLVLVKGVCKSPFRPEKPELTLVLGEASIYVLIFSRALNSPSGKVELRTTVKEMNYG